MENPILLRVTVISDYFFGGTKMVELSDLGIAIAVAGLGGRQEKDWLVSTIEDRTG